MSAANLRIMHGLVSVYSIVFSVFAAWRRCQRGDGVEVLSL